VAWERIVAPGTHEIAGSNPASPTIATPSYWKKGDAGLEAEQEERALVASCFREDDKERMKVANFELVNRFAFELL
jgi:hypothetical protein